jgi:hypothetical protein
MQVTVESYKIQQPVSFIIKGKRKQKEKLNKCKNNG